jgi:hypothetical protein
MWNSRKSITAAACGLAAVGLLVIGNGPAAATDRTGGEQPPPDGARATVAVAPNPTTERGQQVVITGSCGGGSGLREVIGGFPENPTLVDVEIVDPGPDRFVASARLAEFVGNGVGPVFVDCGGQAGVTLLVTHV